MPSQDEKRRSSTAPSQSGIESAFLEEECFAKETGAEWESSMAALETESPFLQDFGIGEGAFGHMEMGWLSEVGMDANYESSEAPQQFIDEEQFELFDTGPYPKRFIQRLEPSSEEEGLEEVEYLQDFTESFIEEEVEEQLDAPSNLSRDITEVLENKDWAQALKLAIKQGWRDVGKLTNLIFYERHPELRGGRLEPNHPKFNRLSREWVGIRNREVWSAIQKSAENHALAVSGKDVATDHRQFWGKSGKKFKSLIEQAAKKVDLNPGLLAATMLAETGNRNDYLTKNKVSSYRIGVDDFYDRRHAIAQRVPVYAKVGWDRNQKPAEHYNDAKKPRIVKTIKFNSGPDALLASAVYLKYGAVRLREEASKLGRDFFKLPLETRWALIRMAFNAGVGGAIKRLIRALKGEDILVRKNFPRKAYQTDRNATIHTARALHLSEWIFGVSMKPTIQPEIESSDAFDEKEEIDEYEFDETGEVGKSVIEEGFSGFRAVGPRSEERLLGEAYTEEDEFLPFESETSVVGLELDAEEYLQKSESVESFDELLEQENQKLYSGKLDASSVKRAILLNTRYSKKLGWEKHRTAIESYLVASKLLVPSMWPESDFPRAVARWQQKRGLKPDGILGPKTWARMKVMVCAGYEPGEVTKSLSKEGHLNQDVFMTKGGWLVIADFAVGRSEIKAATRRERLLRDSLEKFETDPPDEILVIGFSDCVGKEKNNEALRRSRAVQVANLFGPKARTRVRVFSGKMGRYLSDNITSTNRARNRSVLIQWKRDFSFVPEEVTVNPAEIMKNVIRCAILAVKDIPGKRGERIRKMISIADSVGYPKNLKLWYYNDQPMIEYFNWRTDDRRRALMTRHTGGKMPFDGYAFPGEWRVYPFQSMVRRFGSLDTSSCKPKIRNYLLTVHDLIEMSFIKIQQKIDATAIGGGTLLKGAPEAFLKHLRKLRAMQDHLYSAFN